MDLTPIYNSIQSQIKSGSFSLHKNAADLGGINSVCSVFELDSILINSAECTLDNGKIKFSGIFDISSSVKDITAKISLADDGKVTVELNIPSAALDMAGNFIVENCLAEMELHSGKNTFTENISGIINFGGVTFNISSARNSIHAKRNFNLQSGSPINPMSFTASVLKLFGVDLSVFGIDKAKPFSINNMKFIYTAHSDWLTANEPDEIYVNDSFMLNIKTDIGFKFGDKFGFSNAGFAIEKFGSEYDFSLYGNLTVFGSDIPFMCCYGDDAFSFTASQCRKLKLNSMEDMGTLMGEGNISGNFPAGFKPSGNIKLDMLNFVMDADFKSVQNFNISALLDYKWTLCPSPEISVSNIIVSFGYTPAQKFFGITGEIVFCGIHTQISAVVYSGGENAANWGFRWRMFDDETINLTKLIIDLAKQWGLNSPVINIPDIETGRTAVSYEAGTFSLETYILVTNSKLFSSETKIKIISDIKDGKRGFDACFNWKSINNRLTLENVLSECGAGDETENIPSFIKNIGIKEVSLNYCFVKNTIEATVDVSGIGKIEFNIIFAGDKSCKVIFTPDISGLSLADVPVVGGLVQKHLPSVNNFSVTDTNVIILSDEDKKEKIPAGVRLRFKAMGEDLYCQIYEKTGKNLIEAGNAPAPKTTWLKLDKTMAIFTLHRLGVRLDDSRLVLLLDASLNVSPLTFSLYGAGIGLNMSDIKDLKFYISGFGVSFKNNMLSISGAFEKNNKRYTGALMVKLKDVSVNALAEYAEGGYLMAYAVFSANLGGPPAMFITGLALGFGYNKRLTLPSIENVAKYPLITAAQGNTSQQEIISELPKYMTDEKGQSFLTAGVKFKSFEIIDSIALLSASFGKTFEIGLLGISNVTMPPHSTKNPIAHAQLALKAAIKPDDGFLSVEARLTSESYILSKDCKLTGGFAFYLWFGGRNRGDMVITLGGYKAGYKKPAHYPDVPRVGFNWKAGSNVNISGEMYFALTPKEIMAGGRLSVIYSQSNIKAYFIASADFYLGWKPFYYEISVNVLVGASYRVKFWFVDRTFSIELGANLELWGPDFTGTARINWYIISFTVKFGSKEPKGAKKLDWEEFSHSFLPKENKTDKNAPDKIAPITISYTGGLISDEKLPVCRADELAIKIESAIPVTSVSVNRVGSGVTLQNIEVRPMGGVKLESNFTVTAKNEKGEEISLETSFVRQNLPAAMWGNSAHNDTLVKDVICGVTAVPVSFGYKLFPVIGFISLDDLFIRGTIKVKNAFTYLNVSEFPEYFTANSVKRFSETADSDTVKKNRREFLKKMGVDAGEISLKKLAGNAENLLSEDFLVIKEHGIE